VDDRLSRHDLADEEWQRLVPMMPADARQGRRWSDHRMVVNGIFTYQGTVDVASIRIWLRDPVP
jgi:hypothetical protein